MTDRAFVVAWIVLLSTAPIVGVAAGAPAPATPESAAQSENAVPASFDTAAVEDVRGGTPVERGDTVVAQHVTYDMTPDRSDTIDVTMAYETTRDLGALCIDVPDSYAVVSKRGLEEGSVASSCAYDWDGTTTDPSITFRVPSTVDGDDSINRHESTSWAFVTVTSWNRYRLDGETTWYWVDNPSNSRSETTREVSGAGVAGDSFVYFGDVSSASWHVNDEAFQLVVPDAVSVDRDAIEASVTTSARSLDIGGRGERVTMFAARDPIRRGGRAWGDSVWIHHRETVNDVNNVWVHEYVHTRQEWRATPEMEWVREASAEYYAALSAYRQGSVPFSAFYDHVATDEEASVVLSDDTAAAETGAEYTKGSRVVAALDRKIRLATGGNRTFEDVLYLMNRHDDRVSYTDFQEMVERVAGRSLDDWLDRFVTTTAAPGVAGDDSWIEKPPANRDADGDGLEESAEKANGLDPFDADTDNDGLNDSAELSRGTNPHVYDTDGDGLKDGLEVELGTDPTMWDTDADGVDDGEEVRQYDTDPTAYDTDGDGLDDSEELASESLNATNPDTDGDGLNDGEEERLGTDPADPDSDGDGVEDGREEEIGSDPLVVDSDEDGLDDGAEVSAGTDPTVADTDGDGLDDATEVEGETDPLEADSDGDGIVDGEDQAPLTDQSAADSDGLPGPMSGFGVVVSVLAFLVLGAGIRLQRR